MADSDPIYLRKLRGFDRREFDRLYLNEWRPNPIDKYARRYHERCDAYDETVCTARGQDGAMPANGREAAIINRHAAQVRINLTTEAAKELGMSWFDARKQLTKAIIRAAK